MVVYPLTDKCNLRCIFCCNEDFKTYFKPPSYEQPSFQEIKEWFEKIPEYDNNITLTGGEPTLRHDLIEIIDYLRSKFKKANIVLLTNGRRFFYNEYAKQFAKYTNFEVEIPLNSHKKEIHDYLTNCEGSFDQTVHGIKNLLKKNVRVNIRIIITKANYTELLYFMKFLKSEVPLINKVILINMRINGRALKNKKELVVKYSEASSFLKQALGFLSKNKMKIQLLHFPFCILDKKYWQYTLKNPYKQEIPVCRKCQERKNCPGILESYLEHVGEDEFSPFLS